MGEGEIGDLAYLVIVWQFHLVAPRYLTRIWRIKLSDYTCI